MRPVVQGFGVVVLALVAGCGGQVQGGGSGGAGAGSTPSSGGGAGKSGDDSSGTVDFAASTPLGACVLGAAERTGAALTNPCAWVADGRCYDTREMACNCACPRERDSQCLSGFDGGPSGHVAVSCD